MSQTTSEGQPPRPRSAAARNRRARARAKAKAVVARLAETGITAYIDLNAPHTWHTAQVPLRTSFNWPTDRSTIYVPTIPIDAFWSSPAAELSVDGAVLTHWDRHLRSQGAHGTGTLHKVNPAPTSVIVRVRGSEDVAALHATFPTTDSPTAAFEAMTAAGITAIAWEAAALDPADPHQPAWDGWDTHVTAWLTPNSFTVAHDPTPSPLEDEQVAADDDDIDWGEDGELDAFLRSYLGQP